jgi:ABC-2 type transport system permease protein
MSRHDVYVDDNFYLDADERRHLGSFETLEAAVAACRELVETWLRATRKAGMRPEALLNQYYNFGPDPFVRTTDPHDQRPFRHGPTLKRVRRNSAVRAPCNPPQEISMPVLAATWVIFTRALRLSLRQPMWVLIGLMQPILYLVLFGPLLQTVAKTSGFQGDAWQVFVPGLLVQLGIFGGLFVGFGIIAEWRAGVIDRQMVTPASRVALITGRTLRDVLVIVVQAIVLTVCAWLFGLRVPPLALLAGLVLVALLGAAFSFISNAIGIATKSEDALAPLVNALALPILLLSGILLPMSLAPVWLQIVSDFDPFKHIVNALRAVFRDDFADPIVGIGGVLALILVILGAWIGARVLRAQTR